MKNRRVQRGKTIRRKTTPRIRRQDPFYLHICMYPYTYILFGSIENCLAVVGVPSGL